MQLFEGGAAPGRPRRPAGEAEWAAAYAADLARTEVELATLGKRRLSAAAERSEARRRRKAAPLPAVPAAPGSELLPPEPEQPRRPPAAAFGADRDSLTVFRREGEAGIGIEFAPGGALIVARPTPLGPASRLRGVGLGPFLGRLLTHVAGVPVSSVAQVREALAAAGQEVPLRFAPTGLEALPAVPPVLEEAEEEEGEGELLKLDTVESGRGDSPCVGDTVVCHYTLELDSRRGTTVDSTRGGTPLSCVIGSGELIRGFDEALRRMRPGQRAVATVQPRWGYGAAGVTGKVPPNSVLVIDIELLRAVGRVPQVAPPPPAAPEDPEELDL